MAAWAKRQSRGGKERIMSGECLAGWLAPLTHLLSGVCRVASFV